VTDGPGSPTETEREPRTPGEVIGYLVAILFVIAIPILGVWAMIEMFPGDVPERENPGYLDVIFQSRFVVFAARLLVFSAALVLLLGAIYLASSTVVRIKRGQWLRRAGPFESELAEAQDRLGDVSSLLDELNEAWEANEELSRRLEERNQQLADAYAELERLSGGEGDVQRRQGLE
jgi:hypothetical protein